MPKGIPKNGFNKGWFQKGSNGSAGYHWKLSKEILMKRPKRERAQNWRGGISQSREHLRFLQQRWFQLNRDRARYLCRRRYARKCKARGSHTFQEWQDLKQQYDFRCLRCGQQEPEIVLTEDHIIPLKLNGTDFIENIQPLCRNCNSIKHLQIINFKVQQIYAQSC